MADVSAYLRRYVDHWWMNVRQPFGDWSNGRLRGGTKDVHIEMHLVHSTVVTAGFHERD